jgi:hypothetical protein
MARARVTADRGQVAKKGKKTSIGRGKGSKYPHNPRNKKYRKKYRGQGR